MKTYLDCTPCFFRQALSATRRAVEDPERQENIMRMVMEQLSQADYSKSPPHLARDMYRLIKTESGDVDPFKDIKHESNRLVEDLYPELKDIVAQSPNPLETAVKLAIAGNVIDFGANHAVSSVDIHRSIDEALHVSLGENAFDNFHISVSKARNVLYIGDNAGEIVFDRLLIEQLLPQNIVYAVRGFPVINDVTLEDAKEVGMDKIVEVIHNGLDAPGTVLVECSDSFMREYDKADLVIAKGQGNYETLNDEKKHIFFMMKVKCPVVSSDVGLPVNSMMLREIGAD